MAVLRSLKIDWLSQVELLHNDTWPHVEVVLDNADQLARRSLGCAVGVDKDGQGLRHANGVRQLHQNSSSQLSVHKRLCDPAGKVGSRTIDL